ncbi:hypothetical protein BGW38_010332 [Lunasporangiospora selenospora]|uniref:Uncharacterized protein n=1 Tax=Lunasporangiospora selenospora TaxID=979761 RepID=A0A9P6KFS1_9FUNG|nr:hypothetical protein BGW38_010332 [Lunasporangiospora selenospora]
MRVIHDVVRDGHSDTPIPSGDGLSRTCKALYTFICAHLAEKRTALQSEKDLLLALSGVINLQPADASDMFGVGLVYDIELSRPRARPDDSINDTLQLLSDVYNKHGLVHLRDEIIVIDAERIRKKRQTG